jgi:ankyrin repeat protein
MTDSFAAFLASAQTGDLAMLKRLARENGDISAVVNHPNGEGSTALHLASSRGFLDCCEFLAGQGALINVTDTLQRTPLHLAAQAGHGPVVEFLITKDAILDAIDVHFYLKKFLLHS